MAKTTYAAHFKESDTATYKDRKIAELTHDALEHLQKAYYLEHAREDILNAVEETKKYGEPMEKELAALEEIKTPLTREQRDRKKELTRMLVPVRKRINERENDAAQFQQQAEALRIQATERIYRRDFIIANLDKALAIEALDPRMSVDKNTL